MQQVARSIRQKRKRDRLRNKIQSITPHQYSNSVRYYDEQVSPHKILAHQFQHLTPFLYNKREQISIRQVYPISEALVYEPLRYNQLKAEYKRSKSMQEGNEFLSNFSEKEHKKRREEYYQKIKMIEVAEKEEQEQRMEQERQVRREKEKRMRKSAVLPPINHKNKSEYWRLFRAAARAVYFTCFIRINFEKYLKNRKKQCDRQHKGLMRAALQSMQNFYYNKLEKQITLYMLLLEKKIKYPNIKTGLDLLALLTSIFNKLNTLAVPTAILNALSFISNSYSSYPVPFLFTQQLQRLPYLTDFGCTGALDEDQSCMVVAGFVVVKLLCINLFYRPWLAQDLFRKNKQKHIDLRSKYDDLKRVINHMGSLPYFITIDIFLLHCPRLHSKYQIDTYAKDGIINTIPYMRVLPKETEEVDPLAIDSSSGSSDDQYQYDGYQGEPERETEKEKENEDDIGLVVGQNRGFYRKMRNAYPQEMRLLQKAITEWVTKIALSVLKLSAQQRKERLQKLFI